MKKILFVLIVVSSALTVNIVQAQSNAIKINILSPLVKTLNLSFEHALSESSSFQIGFFYTGASIADLKYTGFGITPEYRFYLSESPAPKGVYLAPFIRYQSVKLEDTSSSSTGSATLSAIGGGLVVGKQWIFKERITLDIFLGPSFNSGKVKVEDGTSNQFEDVNAGFDGFGLRTGITLGVAF